MIKKWKRLKGLDKALILDVVGLTAFVVSQVIIYCYVGALPETFDCAVLTCFGIEPVCCAYIQAHKKKEENTDEVSG